MAGENSRKLEHFVKNYKKVIMRTVKLYIQKQHKTGCGFELSQYEINT